MIWNTIKNTFAGKLPGYKEKDMITSEQLLKIMPKCPGDKVQAYAKCLSDAMKEGQINTNNRIACFLGQLAHESNQLREWTENLNYSVKAMMSTWPKRFPTVESATPYAYQPEKLANHVYCDRMGNGNEASGDGWKYRGRSPIQITGRNSYKAAGQFITIDLDNNPDFAAGENVGFRIAMWYWATHNLNTLADSLDILGITKAINGGTIGFAAREAFTKKALEILKA
ncbi:MAG: glycoside hydrolase family 19 protein [Patescibacteria group bacterium]